MAEDEPSKKRPLTTETLELVVAGAHLSGLALNHQLTSLGATLVKTCKTAPEYRMFSLGPKPALIRQPKGSDKGKAFEVEVWAVPIDKVGYFLRDGVKEPLAIGDVLLEDNTIVKGFVGESYAVESAPDISEYSGWRDYKAATTAAQVAAAPAEAAPAEAEKK